MALRRMWDAAFPPASPPDWEVVAGYIGGNTPHRWTDAEWARYPAPFRLPIFTRSHDGDPNADARAAVAWLRSHGVPPGVCVALDYETRIDAAYLEVFNGVVFAAGWLVMVYGSRDTVMQNPRPSGGYWVAHWTGTPHLCAGAAATQWSGSKPFGGAYDPNIVADSTPLWEVAAMSAAGPEHWDPADWTVFLEKMAGLVGRPVAVKNPDGSTEQVPQPILLYRRATFGADTKPTENASAYSRKTLLGAVQAAQAQDPAALAALLANQLEITGIQTDPGGVVKVTFGPPPA